MEKESICFRVNVEFRSDKIDLARKVIGKNKKGDYRRFRKAKLIK